MKRALPATAAFALAALTLGACTEKPQTNAEGVRHDAAPWTGTGAKPDTASAFSAPGWQIGDKTAWEQQLKTRSLGQNEYNRED